MWLDFKVMKKPKTKLPKYVMSRADLCKYPKYWITIHFEADILVAHKKAYFLIYIVFYENHCKNMVLHCLSLPYSSPIMTKYSKGSGSHNICTSEGFIEVNNCLVWCSIAHKPFGSTFVPTPSLLKWRTAPCAFIDV